jgi:hypothetical protein
VLMKSGKTPNKDFLVVDVRDDDYAGGNIKLKAAYTRVFFNECGRFGITGEGSSISYLSLRFVTSPASIFIEIEW